MAKRLTYLSMTIAFISGVLTLFLTILKLFGCNISGKLILYLLFGPYCLGLLVITVLVIIFMFYRKNKDEENV